MVDGLKSGIMDVMAKTPEIKLEYQRKRSKTSEYKEWRKQWSKTRRDETYTWLRQLKEKPCVDCGNSFPHYVMQFDHIDPSSKKFALATIGSGTRSRLALENEVAKCELVCANCHAVRTWERDHMGNGRYA